MSHFKILGSKWGAWSMIHTVNIQMLGATQQKVLARETWHPGSVHPCL